MACTPYSRLTSAAEPLGCLAVTRHEAQRQWSKDHLQIPSAAGTEAGAELSKAQEELAKASEQLPALKDRAERTLVRAPMNGVVKLIANRTIGGVVQPGSTIAEMVPSNDTLFVEAYVRPADIAFVRKGQRAIVKLTA